MDSWINIAALLSAKTKEGGLFVKATEGLPFLLSNGLEVTFVPPILRFPRSSTVKRIEEPSPGKYLVYFDDITTRSEAEKLEGHYCLVRKNDLPDNFDETEEVDVVGFVVSDESLGEIGSVVRIAENPAHPLLVIARSDSFSGEDVSSEALIPLVDAFIVDIDEQKRTISVSLPDGLLDL